MRRRPGSLLASAIALLIGCGMLGPGGPIGQDATSPSSGESQGIEPEETPAKREARALQPGSTRPPKNLKKVGDHWTPYDPPDPESFPRDAVLHIIVPGDTLWDLADLAFGNPYLWPQIWNENRYILDSHWIYPGDPLLLPARPALVTEIVPQGPEGAPAVVAMEPPAAQQESAPSETAEEVPVAERPQKPAAPLAQRPPDTPHAPRTVPKVEPLADDVDIRCSGFIARKDTKPDYFIANQEDEAKVGLMEADIIYLNRGKENGHVEPGTEYSIVLREGEVRHPVTHNFIGHYYKRLGTVKILAGHDRTAVAVISMACDEIRTGYDLVPLLVTTMPASEPPRFNRHEPLDPEKPSGVVVRNADNMRRVGTGYLVDIDLGFDDGIKPGDFLKIYLPTPHYDKYRKVAYDYEWDNRRFQSPEGRRDRGLEFPARIIGQLVVLATEKHTATAKIIYALREIEVGTAVELY